MGIFNHDSSATHMCQISYPLVKDAAVPFIQNFSFRQFNMILSGCCALFSIVTIVALLQMHALRYSMPNEQSKIMKICIMVAWYALFSWLAIAFPNAYVYFSGCIDLFQSIALSSFFLLMCEYVSPDVRGRDLFFAAYQVSKKNSQVQEPHAGLVWFRRRWIAIFQYPVITVGVLIATCVTEAANLYCLEESKIYFAHLWLAIISSASLVFAVLSIMLFYRGLKDEMPDKKLLPKLLAFKGLVFLTFVQKTVFWILRSTNTLQPSSTLTYADANRGIPTMLICCEMVFFAVYFHYAYPAAPYLLRNLSPISSSSIANIVPSPSQRKNGQQSERIRTTLRGVHKYHGGFMGCKAWLDTFNPVETIRAVVFALTMAKQAKREGGLQNVTVVYKGVPTLKG